MTRTVWDLAADLADPPATWQPLPHQQPPRGIWETWLLAGGRGSGKTDGAAHWFDTQMRRHPGWRGAIVAPTLGDAVEACVNGPSGLKAHNPTVKFGSRPGGLYVDWPNGAQAKLFGAHTPADVDRLRAGGNRHVAWAEELAAWRHLEDAWQHLWFGLRLGDQPRCVASTTPKARRWLIDHVVHAAGTISTHGTTDDNPHLDAGVRSRLYDAYGGTRLGRQELHGEWLTDIPGALWTYNVIDQARRSDNDLPAFRRITVGVDPAITAAGAETGIVVAGIDHDGNLWLLDDRTIRGSPQTWAEAAAGAYDAWSADTVVAERNQGGDMVLHTLRTVAPLLPVRLVTATRGKRVRAEPVAALWEQGRARIAGQFPELEDQLATWTPDDPVSPDRLDAYVWAATDLVPGLSGRRQVRVVA